MNPMWGRCSRSNCLGKGESFVSRCMKQPAYRNFILFSLLCGLTPLSQHCGSHKQNGVERYRASGQKVASSGPLQLSWRCLSLSDPCFAEDVLLREASDGANKLQLTYTVRCSATPAAGSPYFLLFGEEKINLPVGERQSLEFSGPDQLLLAKVDREVEGINGCGLTIHGVRSK
jgi:hypothetical protein